MTDVPFRKRGGTVEDPWLVAARSLRAQNAADASARARRAQAEQQRQEQARAERQRQAAEMRDAIQLASIRLDAFMEERGDAAAQLLDAFGDHGLVLFGCDEGDELYESIYIYGGGIGKESGHKVGRERRRDKGPVPATVREAVEAFAYEGEGRNNPAQVRAIVAWLTRRIDTLTGVRST